MADLAAEHSTHEGVEAAENWQLDSDLQDALPSPARSVYPTPSWYGNSSQGCHSPGRRVLAEEGSDIEEQLVHFTELDIFYTEQHNVEQTYVQG